MVRHTEEQIHKAPGYERKPMAEAKKNEQVKLFIVIGLAIAAAIFAYFRFFYEKSPSSAIPGLSATPVVKLEVPKIDYPSSGKKPAQQTRENSSQYAAIRDIFSPMKLLSQIQGEQEPAKKPVPAFNLSGTILGGGAPVAIINSKFLRTGDRINDFRVVEISKNQVRLRSGDKQIVLEVLKPKQGL